MNIIGRAVICTGFIFTCIPNAHAVSTFGVKATGGDLEPVSSFQQDGGEGSSSASVSFTTYRAEASFDPLSTYLPILKAESTGLDSLFDDDRTNAEAMAYQEFTSAIDQTISLNIRLDSDVFNLPDDGTLPAGRSSVLANVFVYGDGGPGSTVNDGYCSPGKFTFDGVYLCGQRKGQSSDNPGLNYSNLINRGSDPVVLDIFTFSVVAGENFGIFAELSAGSFRGFADAFSTLTLGFEDDEFISAVNTPSMSVVPLPAAVWLFGTALLGIAGFSRRKDIKNNNI